MAEHHLHIDEQAEYDLAVNVIFQQDLDAMIQAIERAVSFWPGLIKCSERHG